MDRKVKSSLFCFGLLILIVYLQGCAADKTIIEPGTVTEAEKNKEAYKINAGDILDITTWKEPDFSKENILVRADGKISFFMLNDIEVSGLTPIELKNKIESALESYVQNPIVTVYVTEPVIHKIYIFGEVEETGEYPLSKNLTVLQALAMAGGFTRWASRNEILVLRNEGNGEKTYRINYKKIMKGEAEHNLRLKANDTIIVP
jgi:polysaccharide export outer membrane protein